MRREWISIALLTFFIGVVKFYFHEFWKDEWQAWLVVRDMPFWQMLSFLNYEGHPALWYLYLLPFTWLSNLIEEDLLLNAAHLILVFATMYVLFIKTNLPYYIKIMIALSFFIFFEYGVINRAYLFVGLFALMAAYYYQANKFLYFSIVLLLLSQTEVYGVIIAGALLLYYFQTQKYNSTLPYTYFGIGLLWFVLTVYPRGNTDDFTRAYHQGGIHLTTIFTNLQGYFANNFLIGSIDDTSRYGYSQLGLGLSGLLVLFLAYLFKDDRKLMVVWWAGAMGFLLFGIFIFTGGVRHWGMLYVFFITVLAFSQGGLFQSKVKAIIVVGLMIMPVIHTFKAVYNEVNINFSNAKAAGQFIKNKIPDNVAIVSFNKFETAAAAAYAGRKFYELPSGVPFSYFKWLEKVYVPTQSELMLFAKYKGAKGLIVVSEKPVNENRFPILKLWQKFDDESFKSEDYYFYVLDLTGTN